MLRRSPSAEIGQSSANTGANGQAKDRVAENPASDEVAENSAKRD